MTGTTEAQRGEMTGLKSQSSWEKVHYPRLLLRLSEVASREPRILRSYFPLVSPLGHSVSLRSLAAEQREPVEGVCPASS